MDIPNLATTVAALASGLVAAPALRQAILLRKHGVPALPKRVLPPPLPQRARAVGQRTEDDQGMDALQVARYRVREALGVADYFGSASHWRIGV